MGTLTIRHVPDEQITAIKQAAKRNKRSMEAEVRSHLEGWTASLVAHQAMTSGDLYAEVRRLLGDDGLDDDETVAPTRAKDDARPVNFGG